MTSAHLIFAASMSIVMILIYTNFAVTSYIASRKLEYIENLLINCDVISGEKKLWLHAGLFGKVLRLTHISFILLIPQIYARKNLVDIKEINSLPSKIKTPLVILGAAHLILTIAFFGLGIFMYYLPPLSK
ncbi:hypothetical protein KU43P_45790 [Pseudomonas sp. KU43P]|nr:hypothetical protein KU43P_45790 [Pseudomonas sp. KU43P]